MNELSVGIGCLHLEVPSAKTSEEWSRRVVSILEAIPSVRDVELDGVIETDHHSFFRAEELYFKPHPVSGVLKFRLTIPNRIQAEVFPYFSGKHAEDFTVVTFYWRDFPVTFVTEVGGGLDADAAGAVAIVREFLIREIARLGTVAGDGRLACVGPSPFHADVKVLARVNDSTKEEFEGDRPLSFDIKAKLGYPTLSIYYNPAEFDNPQEALADFFHASLDQLSYYYLMERLRYRRLSLIVKMRNDAQDLVAVHRAPGFRGWWNRLTRSGRLARELSLSTISLSLQFDEERRRMEESVDYLCGAAELPAFKKWLEEDLEDDFSEALKNCREISDLLDPRRLREANVVLVVLVAVVSAFLGAVVKQIFG